MNEKDKVAFEEWAKSVGCDTYAAIDGVYDSHKTRSYSIAYQAALAHRDEQIKDLTEALTVAKKEMEFRNWPVPDISRFSQCEAYWKVQKTLSKYGTE